MNWCPSQAYTGSSMEVSIAQKGNETYSLGWALQESASLVFTKMHLIMTLFFPSFCVVWAILWYISNGNLAKVSCCCRCCWKWSRSRWYWADGWCNGWGGTTLEFPWDSKSYLKGQVGLGVGKKQFSGRILPGTSLLWYAACLFFIK